MGEEPEKHKPVKERKLVTFVSDKFANYKNAFNKLFYRTCKLAFGVPIACKKHGLKHNNNPIERYNGSIKDRTKTMKDFTSHNGAESFLNLRRTIHNLVNPHQGLKGKTPAEAAKTQKDGSQIPEKRILSGKKRLQLYSKPQKNLLRNIHKNCKTLVNNIHKKNVLQGI